MKTRIVYPKLWNDVQFAELKPTSKLLFCYLINNEKLGLSRYTRITDRQIAFDTGLGNEQINTAKQDLEALGWCFFYDEWIYHNHEAAYMDYSRNDYTEKAKQKEIDEVPETVKEMFKQRLNPRLNPTENDEVKKDGYIDTKGLNPRLNDVQTTFKPRLNRNKKLEIINNNNNNNNNINNNNTGIEKEKENTKEKEKEELTIEEKAKWVIDTYNEIFSKTLKSYVAITSNLEYWLSAGYSSLDIKKAMQIARYDEYWGDKLNPVILLRRKNTRGEDVDYIGQFLAKDKKYMPVAQRNQSGILEKLAAKEAEGGQNG